MTGMTGKSFNFIIFCQLQLVFMAELKRYHLILFAFALALDLYVYIFTVLAKHALAVDYLNLILCRNLFVLFFA